MTIKWQTRTILFALIAAAVAGQTLRRPTGDISAATRVSVSEDERDLLEEQRRVYLLDASGRRALTAKNKSAKPPKSAKNKSAKPPKSAKNKSAKPPKDNKNKVAKKTLTPQQKEADKAKRAEQKKAAEEKKKQAQAKRDAEKKKKDEANKKKKEEAAKKKEERKKNKAANDEKKKKQAEEKKKQKEERKKKQAAKKEEQKKRKEEQKKKQEARKKERQEKKAARQEKRKKLKADKAAKRAERARKRKERREKKREQKQVKKKETPPNCKEEEFTKEVKCDPIPKPPLPLKCSGVKASWWGDPHITTFDGVKYDCQGEGEFSVIKSLQSDFELQGRFMRPATVARPTVTKAIAFNPADGEPTIQIQVQEETGVTECALTVFVGGKKYVVGKDTAPEGMRIEAGQVQGKPGLNILYENTDLQLGVFAKSWSQNGCYMAIDLCIPDCYHRMLDGEKFVGLLGTPDGDNSNDWMDRDGTTVPFFQDFVGEYNYCVNNWCLDEAAESLFVYPAGKTFDDYDKCDLGEDQETADCIDFPGEDIIAICADDRNCVVDGCIGGVEAAKKYIQAAAFLVDKNCGTPLFSEDFEDEGDASSYGNIAQNDAAEALNKLKETRFLYLDNTDPQFEHVFANIPKGADLLELSLKFYEIGGWTSQDDVTLFVGDAEIDIGSFIGNGKDKNEKTGIASGIYWSRKSISASTNLGFGALGGDGSDEIHEFLLKIPPSFFESGTFTFQVVLTMKEDTVAAGIDDLKLVAFKRSCELSCDGSSVIIDDFEDVDAAGTWGLTTTLKDGNTILGPLKTGGDTIAKQYQLAPMGADFARITFTLITSGNWADDPQSMFLVSIDGAAFNIGPFDELEDATTADGVTEGGEEVDAAEATDTVLAVPPVLEVPVVIGETDRGEIIWERKFISSSSDQTVYKVTIEVSDKYFEDEFLILGFRTDAPDGSISAGIDDIVIATFPDPELCKSAQAALKSDPELFCPTGGATGAIPPGKCYKSWTEEVCAPTPSPTFEATVAPTISPTTNTPTSTPETEPPTPDPTEPPTPEPESPTMAPTLTPPTTDMPTSPPETDPPTSTPTGVPTLVPTSSPTGPPTQYPTRVPTGPPTDGPTSIPVTDDPTASPTSPPETDMPTSPPTSTPETEPPTPDPTEPPTPAPEHPTMAPTPTPPETDMPTSTPETEPPTPDPTEPPTPAPEHPTMAPTPTPPETDMPTSPPETEPPTPAPTPAPEKPTLAPTIKDKSLPTAPPAPPVTMTGDPHIKTWAGQNYDFHGECDLVLLDNPDFNYGQGMRIHVRTKIQRWWSYIESAAVQIGADIFEVKSGIQDRQYWYNGKNVTNFENGRESLVSHHLPFTVGGFDVRYRVKSDHVIQYKIFLPDKQVLVLRSVKEWLHVELDYSEAKDFSSSVGLMGTFGEGVLAGRDGTVYEDLNAFGQEWQVHSDEPQLFHFTDGPQHPDKCLMPDESTSATRRYLKANTITRADAKKACGNVNKGDFNNCVFDVMAMDDIQMADGY